MSKTSSLYITLLIIIIALLGFTLPFHYVSFEGQTKVWAKDHWTFRHTYIDKEIVHKIVTEYNEESIEGRIGMQNGLYRTLKEHKVVRENEDGIAISGFD